MKRFVINLDQATERLAWMNATFERLGLSYERVPAVDKDHLSDEAIRNVVDPTSIGWSRGEVACFLSHIDVWKKIAAGADDYAAVFEDDVHMSDHAAEFLSTAGWISSGTDLIKLETTLNPVRTGESRPVQNAHRLVKLQSFHNGSAGYIISRRHAAALMASAVSIDRPVDDFIFDLHKAECWQLSPAVCIQDMFLPGSGKIASTLEDGRQEARGSRRLKPRQSFLSKLAREVRRLAHKVARTRRNIVPIGPLPSA